MIVSTILKNPPLGYENRFSGDYELNDMPEDRISVLKKYNYQFRNPIWNGSDWIEGLTPEEISQKQAEFLKQKETDLYIKRMQDAQLIWAGLSAEFRIAKQIGQMDDATENIILAELKPVLDIIVPFGQWKTGYQLLLGIGSSVIGQDLYNKLHDIIWNYIQENYEEIEISELRQSVNRK